MELLKDKKFTIYIQGCRTNQYEGEAIAAALECEGASQSDGSPDIIVVVTCSITAVADRKCRKLLRRARREHPRAVIAACGCYVQKMERGEMERLGLDIAVGNRLKHLLPSLIADRLGGSGPALAVNPDVAHDASWDGLSLDRPRLRTRAFLKVQDGCAHYCSYCIVPYLRGRPVSRHMEEAVEEARRITESGCPEIILTGVHLGLYEELPELVRRIGSLPLLKRLRFGSIEPFAVDEKLLNALASTPAFCEHLHMPLQSGDDGVLSAMRRGYGSAGFAGIAERARAVLGEDLHISTDLMVGFPAEDAAAFKRSMDFVRDMAFGKVHVFPYSPREGTKAAAMEQLPESVIGERASAALALAGELHEKFCSRWIGKEVSILVEEEKNNSATGLTRNYIRVCAPGSAAAINSEIVLRPSAYENEALIASPDTDCRPI